ncbi:MULTISPECIES: alpha-D-glucose phosphate-specific phosphoglucomutase [Hydrocarboniphaga]|jgi:phosphoglucomutase|uniref:phosphoglucomutase (alpha-D-glucose-1,6-bisphosphate-dependent) n=1 Tax=Hydrocarboniphaga effusa AP103 TaxID=1172194 RepID=I8HY93_9GAMM|nr:MULTISPECIES: alpha-D-glucose phosphate-specific phosphoglucomutase [Hydrocarboniphaga]EIT68431.1 phosphoglucomutase [Hydrocarboniphaga effusa AP103]MDZ4078583.1 alpha-D-glucose phosphate-specific phosphoglucomutase [Hydrocarboniphaga sp.]
MPVREIATKPFSDQKSGTAGLRKKVAVFQQPHYLENFLQSIFDVETSLRGKTLVMGGDGRYHNRTAIQTAIAMAAANGVAKVIVGQGGILSTPASSHMIRISGAAGGLVFTASHNPAGEDGDFGLKFNIAGGGQASETLTNRIYEASKSISRYRIEENVWVDLDRRGSQKLGDMDIEVVDCVDDYAALMQTLFDFDRIRDWFKKGHSLAFDAMHAVTGPYAQRIFVDLLGAPQKSVMNASPLEDFGGGHPDPNLIYAKPLVDLMYSDHAPDLGGASDGDGDRNMILGRGIFISPGDSLAMLAAHLDKLPGYKKGLAGVARSMPTCRALDMVAKGRGLACYETPTGWKFFANLLDSGRITLCGEESFGTSSNHVREKDGVWAVLAWLNVLAETGLSMQQIADAHWKQYGRHYYARHDYDELPTAVANQVMETLIASLPRLAGQKFGEWTVSQADEFGYEDPVDGSVAKSQGIRIVFGEAARLILRLSGTGTKGATLRLYLERYETAAEKLGYKTGEALAPLAAIADQLIRIGEITGRKAPDVVT